MQKILLLDIENCPHSSERLLAQLKQYAEVCLVYAKSNMSLSLDDLVQFEPYLANQRLKLLKMPSVGKDSADFGLAFLAGRLSQQYHTREYTFDVFSNDRSMGYIVELLKKFGFGAMHLKREVTANLQPVVNSIQTESGVNIAQAIESIPEQKTELYLQKLAEVLVKNQPKTITALCNGIRSWLKIEHQQANALMLLMQQQKIIQVHNKTVEYHKQKLKQIINAPILGRLEERLVDTKKEMPTLTDIQSKLHLMHICQYCEYLHKQQGKPATHKALIHSLAAVLKIESESLLKNRFKLLKNYGILMVLENEKLLYDHQAIIKWAELSGSYAITRQTQHAAKPQLGLDCIFDTQKSQFEEEKAVLHSSNFMAPDDPFIQKLRDRLNLSNGIKPRYVAGLSVLLEQLFPQFTAEKSLDILEKNELIQINKREIIYSAKLIAN